MTGMPAPFDVAIVGGGLSGASLAVALAPLPLKVALIEAAAPPKAAPAWDERTIALNLATRRIFEGLGVWSLLRPDAEPILSTHISERGRFGVARFSAQDAGEDALGHNVPIRAIGEALWRRLDAVASKPTVLCPARVTGLTHADDHVELALDAKDTGHISARLVVAADGAQSVIRKFLGIGAQERDYGQTAIVSAVRPGRPHHGVAYERFTPDGPIALLPRPDGRCALVWTVPTEKARALLALSESEFLAGLQDAFGHRLGRFLEAGRRMAFPLVRVMSEQLTAPRVIFAGNAAQTLHPVAAQGFNLGLRDVATVAELLAGADDPGADTVLAAYEARRAQDRTRVAGFTDQLVRLFSNATPGLSDARHLGLLALDLVAPIKAAVMRQNLGFGGHAPALARGTIPAPRRAP